MASRSLPGLALTGFWDLGSTGWKTGMDANLLAVSVLLKAVALSRITNLPGSPVNGDIYIVPDGQTNEKKVAFRDNGAWGYITAWEGLQFWVDDENAFVTFNGADWTAGSAGSVPEAPIDGTQYGRKDGVWVAVAAGGSANRTISAKTASYTLAAADNLVKINAGHASTPIVITLPQNSDAAFPIGGWLPVENTNVATVTIQAGTGATAVNGPSVLAQGEVAIIWKNATNGWTVSKLGGTGGGTGERTISAKTADYTLGAADNVVKINAGHASTPIAISVPQNSTAAVPIGAWIPIENTNVATVTVQAGSGATLVGGPATLAQGEIAIVWKNSTNGWTVSKFGTSGATFPTLAGNAGKHLAVNDDEDGVEWVDDEVGGFTNISVSFFAGGVPTASVLIARFTAVESFSIPSGAAGSYGTFGTAPTGGSVVIDLKKNGTSFGSLTFSASATTGVFSVGTTTSFVAGDNIDFVAPSDLRTAANLSVSMLGSL